MRTQMLFSKILIIFSTVPDDRNTPTYKNPHISC